MQWVNVSYATYFNRKRGRHGHLFQGRFKAILIDADEYLKHLPRYIHLKLVSSRGKKSPAAELYGKTKTGGKRPKNSPIPYLFKSDSKMSGRLVVMPSTPV